MDVGALQTLHQEVAHQPRVLIGQTLSVSQHEVAVQTHVPAGCASRLMRRSCQSQHASGVGCIRYIQELQGGGGEPLGGFILPGPHLAHVAVALQWFDCMPPCMTRVESV